MTDLVEEFYKLSAVLNKATGLRRVGELLTGSRLPALEGVVGSRAGARSRVNHLSDWHFKKALDPAVPLSSRQFSRAVTRTQQTHGAVQRAQRVVDQERSAIRNSRLALGAGTALGTAGAVATSKEASPAEAVKTMAQQVAAKSQSAGRLLAQAGKAGTGKPLLSRNVQQLGGLAAAGAGVGAAGGLLASHKHAMSNCLDEITKMAEPKTAIYPNPDGSFTVLRDGAETVVDRKTMLQQFPEFAPPAQKQQSGLKPYLKVIGKSALGLAAGYGAGVGAGHLMEAAGRRAGVPAGNIARKISPLVAGGMGMLYPIWKATEQKEMRDVGTNPGVSG